MQYDLCGQKFGSLAVVKQAVKKPEYHGQLAWVCRCDCGKRHTVTGRELRTGHTRSCGCKKPAMCAAANVVHGAWLGVRCGKAKVWPEWRVWQAMKERCSNRKNARYRRYGGRGIKVCRKWVRSFKAFIEDMGRRPSSKHSIDRINNDGNYEPGNCRWATMKQQRANRT